jgi:hypothetical protein
VAICNAGRAGRSCCWHGRCFARRTGCTVGRRGRWHQVCWQAMRGQHGYRSSDVRTAGTHLTQAYSMLCCALAGIEKMVDIPIHTQCCCSCLTVAVRDNDSNRTANKFMKGASMCCRGFRHDVVLGSSGPLMSQGPVKLPGLAGLGAWTAGLKAEALASRKALT